MRSKIVTAVNVVTVGLVVAVGYEADLVVLAGDPVRNVRDFARMRHTIRAGELIYSSP